MVPKSPNEAKATEFLHHQLDSPIGANVVQQLATLFECVAPIIAAPTMPRCIRQRYARFNDERGRNVRELELLFLLYL